MLTKKKLIEVALPLDTINRESINERYCRAGHPAQLHLWWARRPLVTTRAVIWASLVDDPSAHPEKFPTVEAQQKERERLFGILEKLVVWENSDNEEILNAAKAEIWKSTNGNPPELLDPFAGGGAIPLEAQRLGLTAHASDLNPVAVMINKAMIEIPPKFSGQPPVNPASAHLRTGTWKGAAGLADDVRYYGEWMKNEAFRRIGYLFPKVKIPKEQGGGEATVIAWIWARTVKCPNPACGCEMPLASSFVLSKKTGREAYLVPQINNGRVGFLMRYGSKNKAELKHAEFGTKYKNEKEKGKKATFCCPVCKAGVVNGEYADDEANVGRMGVMPLAIVAEGSHGRIYLPFESESARVLLDEVQYYYTAHQLDTEVPHAECRGTFASNAQGRIYGFREFKDYFTKRQLTALTTFSDLVGEAQKQAEADAVAAGLVNDHIPLSEGGTGARAYGEAVGVYLAFAVNKIADYNSSLCRWQNASGKAANTYSRQAIPMVWDFAEANVFSDSYGGVKNKIAWTSSGLSNLVSTRVSSHCRQFDAQSDIGMRNIMISTDPPYYDNIGYADLSDFFYVWMRRTLKDTYPKLFRTMLVPKAEELIATPYRFDGSVEKARDFFEDGMYRTFCQVLEYARDDVPVTIYYAFKQSETIEDDDEDGQQTASTGWETMLSAIIRAGFAITGTWPMRTEMSNRSIASGTNALASSIVLVCRKRPESALTCTRREFVNALKRELKPALRDLQNANIAPVDMAQSAIGPGMGVFSRYRNVLEADGSPMSVRSALQIINQELDAFFNEQDGELDSGSRFCVDLYSQCAFNTMKYGEAQVLENAKGTSIASLVNHGALEAAKGNVRLKTREELPETVSPNEECIWLLTQQLTHTMEQGGITGCAKIVSSIRGGRAESAKALAYRLFTIADRKKWTQEAFAYNALVIAWPEIQQRAVQMQVLAPAQMRMEL